MGKNKIYEKDWKYTCLRPFVDWCTRRSYRRIQVQGEENLPTDGAILLSPNHSNTLMDALVMLQAYKKETVFGARADMFNNPFIARIMFFLRILPMVRQRDGLRNVLKNHDTQETIVETLEHGVRFCMFPEGRHRTMHSLLPLGKGTMRAAVAANEKFGNDRPIYIVPVGIEYGDYFRYRSTCLVTYGKPINATEFIKGLNVENDAQIMEPLKREIAERMSGLFTYIKDDENYKGTWALTKMLASEKRTCSLAGRLETNRAAVAEIEKAIAERPEEMAQILEKAAALDAATDKAGISIHSFNRKCLVGRCVWKGLLSILGLPYFLFSAVASLPMWALATFLRRKIKDKAFGNTVGFGVKLGLGAIWYPIVAALAFIFAPWQYALAGSLLAFASYNYLYDYTEFMRRFLSDCRLATRKDFRSRFEQLQKDFHNLK